MKFVIQAPATVGAALVCFAYFKNHQMQAMYKMIVDQQKKNTEPKDHQIKSSSGLSDQSVFCTKTGIRITHDRQKSSDDTSVRPGL